jgi:hypothetical protein
MANENQMSSFDDEISLTDLFLKLWHRRGLIIALPVLAAMMGLIFILFQASEAKTPTIQYVNLTAVDKGLYPNGVAFSPQDLKAPEVLNALAARAGVADIGDLRDAITVSYASPVTKGILKKYEEKLGQKGINAAQIDALNAELQEELTRSTQRTLRVSIDHQGLGLSSEQGAELAILLPQLWSEIFTTKFRVLDNTKLSNAILPDRLSLTSTLGIIEARRIILNAIETLKIIEADNRLQSLTGEAGVTPTDLRLQLSYLDDIYLNGVLSENIASGDVLARIYLNDILLDIERYNEELEGVGQTIQSMQMVLSRDAGEARSKEAAQSSAASVQLSGDAIEDIAALVNRSALAEYLTQLYERKAEMVSKRAALKIQIRKAESGEGFGPELVAGAETDLNRLVKSYASLLTRAREMNQRTAGELHQALGAPITTGSLLPPRAPLILALSIVLGGFVAVVLALLLPGRQRDAS